ncbi:hypothetical protein ACEQ38_16995 [Ralstonia syzygii subsp. celebesensis]|uniref:Uncharacterized protein n=1 Tax=blood disease bacterium R229 TaxID=741978 RepID=G2ZXJ0_9RALS|nr:hypothetical protein [Ralstonia syzygii]CCA83769.1 hypothetical protein BDB_mp70223 [blood disease bacterium R229]
MPPRDLKVQTPGEAPQTDTTAEELETEGTTPDAESAANDTPPAEDLDALRARIAELEVQNAELAAKNAARDPVANSKAAAEADAAYDRASRSISRADREKFKDMRAHEVDPTTLVAAVLTKDGWVAPDQTGQKPRG